jgi:Icc protein
VAAPGRGGRAAAHIAVAVLEPLVDAAPSARVRPPAAVARPVWELTTVSDDHAVAFDGMVVKQYDGLSPDTAYSYDGVAFRTLPRPGGARLSTITTVNDVHFGEVRAGYIEGSPGAGPYFSVAPGEPPYPETMNGAAVEEIAAVSPDLVVVKGDLTSDGLDSEYEAFLHCWSGAFGERLLFVRGNHDAYRFQTFAAFGPQLRSVVGASVALLDTAVPGLASGRVDAAQLAWLEDVGASASASSSSSPVLVMGHHHAWMPGSSSRPESYFGIHPDDSEALVAVVARHPTLVGYWAGHTHRNRVRRFASTGGRPWAEVACVKDFPGGWAEYRVFEGGVLQVFHRIRRPDALAWTERTRGMFGGLYPQYAFGSLADRCFVV